MGKDREQQMTDQQAFRARQRDAQDVWKKANQRLKNDQRIHNEHEARLRGEVYVPESTPSANAVATQELYRQRRGLATQTDSQSLQTQIERQLEQNHERAGWGNLVEMPNNFPMDSEEAVEKWEQDDLD